MCLKITEESLIETKELKEKGLPIIAYKLLYPNMLSLYEDYQWQLGKNVSDRKLAEIKSYELKYCIIETGFHFFVEKPEGCQYPCMHIAYRGNHFCLSEDFYLYRYKCAKEYNRVFKVEIQPEDLVAVGYWEPAKSLVATKCQVLEEV